MGVCIFCNDNAFFIFNFGSCGVIGEPLATIAGIIFDIAFFGARLGLCIHFRQMQGMYVTQCGYYDIITNRALLVGCLGCFCTGDVVLNVFLVTANTLIPMLGFVVL